MAQCPACGSLIDDESRICPFCGSATKGQTTFGHSGSKDAPDWIDELKAEIDSFWLANPELKQRMDQNFTDNIEADPDLANDMDGDAINDTDSEDMADINPHPIPGTIDTEPQYGQGPDSMDDMDASVSQNDHGARPKGTFRKNGETRQSRRRNRRRNMIFATLLGVLIVGILITIFAISSIKPKVDLDQYLSMYTDGYDSTGHATVKLNIDELHNAYAKTVENIDQMVKECVDYEIDPSTNLSNGDVVKLTWKCDDRRAKEVYGCILKYSDLTFVVDDLKEGEAFDPFEGVKVTFEGMNGQGVASYDAKTSKNVKKMNLSFTFDKSEELSNGDVVTLRLDNVKDDDTSEFLEEYGMVPSPLSMEFTVSGLNTYVTSSDQITDEALRVMKEKGEEYYNSHLSEEFSSEGEEYKGIDYQGYYLLYAKDSKNTNPVNKVYLVYKAHVLNTAHPYHQENIIYWYTSFSNIDVGENGENNFNLEDYKTPEDTFSITLGSGWQKASWYYHGYESLDDLYMAVVSDQSDDYAHEENVHDDGVGPGEVIEDQDTTEEASTEKNEETSATYQSGTSEEGIVFSDSSSRYLTQAEVDSLSLEEIRSATNEIFARAGYIFNDSSLREFYKQYSWYQPKVSSDQFDMEEHMNEKERANVVLLEKERESRN